MRSFQPGRGPSPDHAATLILDFQLPGLWEIYFCCLQGIQSVIFYYSNWNRLRYTSFNSWIAAALWKNKTIEKEPEQFFTIWYIFKYNLFFSTSQKFSTFGGTTPILRSRHHNGFLKTESDSSLWPGFTFRIDFSEFQESHKRVLFAPAGTGHETHQHFYKCPSCHYSSSHWQRPCCFLSTTGPANGTLRRWRFCKAGKMFTRMSPARKPISFIP